MTRRKLSFCAIFAVLVLTAVLLGAFYAGDDRPERPVGFVGGDPSVESCSVGVPGFEDPDICLPSDDGSQVSQRLENGRYRLGYLARPRGCSIMAVSTDGAGFMHFSMDGTDELKVGSGWQAGEIEGPSITFRAVDCDQFVIAVVED